MTGLTRGRPRKGAPHDAPGNPASQAEELAAYKRKVDELTAQLAAQKDQQAAQAKPIVTPIPCPKGQAGRRSGRGYSLQDAMGLGEGEENGKIYCDFSRAVRDATVFHGLDPRARVKFSHIDPVTKTQIYKRVAKNVPYASVARFPGYWAHQARLMTYLANSRNSRRNTSTSAPAAAAGDDDDDDADDEDTPSQAQASPATTTNGPPPPEATTPSSVSSVQGPARPKPKPVTAATKTSSAKSSKASGGNDDDIELLSDGDDAPVRKSSSSSNSSNKKKKNRAKRVISHDDTDSDTNSDTNSNSDYEGASVASGSKRKSTTDESDDEATPTVDKRSKKAKKANAPKRAVA